MKIKIIKHSEREKIKETIPAAESHQLKQPDARRAMTATINFWIDDLRQKRERERLSILKLFKQEYST